jgi:hypothetical protein
MSENEGTRIGSLSSISDVRCDAMRFDSVLPKPADLWPKRDQHLLLGLFFVFSIAWALEQCVMLT